MSAPGRGDAVTMTKPEYECAMCHMELGKCLDRAECSTSDAVVWNGTGPGRRTLWHHEAYRSGAAALGGLMGMAEAIRSREGEAPPIKDWRKEYDDLYLVYIKLVGERRADRRDTPPNASDVCFRCGTEDDTKRVCWDCMANPGCAPHDVQEWRAYIRKLAAENDRLREDLRFAQQGLREAAGPGTGFDAMVKKNQAQWQKPKE